MTTIDLGTLSPVDEDVKHIDTKQAAFFVHPVTLDTPSLTPATTPDQISPIENDTMAGKKLFSMEKPNDRAKDLAAKLTLEEQVRYFSYSLT
jgi:beta-glucosidase